MALSGFPSQYQCLGNFRLCLGELKGEEQAFGVTGSGWNWTLGLSIVKEGMSLNDVQMQQFFHLHHHYAVCEE